MQARVSCPFVKDNSPSKTMGNFRLLYVISSLLCIAAIALAFIIKTWYNADVKSVEWETKRELFLIDRWRAITESNTQSQNRDNAFRNILIGVNTNVDLIVSGLKLLELLKVSCNATDDFNENSHINSLEDLHKAFAHYFHRGHAAERHCLNGHFFTHLVRIASHLQNAEWFIGGNAALMAQTMVTTFRKKVTLVGPVGDKLKDLLNDSIIVPSCSRKDKDEVHLIMEYQVGDKCGMHTTPIANRFILTHDVINSELSLIADLFDQLQQPAASSPAHDLFILTGLHFLEALPEVKWMQKCDEISVRLRELPTDVACHMELASMMSVDVVSRLSRQLIPHVDSVGLNEQELAFISHVSEGSPHPNLYKDMKGQPMIDEVADILYWLMTDGAVGETRLSRIHFHTLTYHMISVDQHPTRRQHNTKWSDQLLSVVSGAVIAGKQACNDHQLDPGKLHFMLHEQHHYQPLYEKYERINDTFHPLLIFHRRHITFYFSPVLVCRKPVKTVGLGDAISSTGLMMSTFNAESPP